MRIPVNLAREPFRPNRPLYIGAIFAALVMLGGLGISISSIITERRQSDATRTALGITSRQLATIRAEQSKLDALIRKPGNEVVLDRSILINDLIRRKAISWTKIFSDLEQVLPPNVRVVSISPKVNARNQLFLDMSVAADSQEPVIAFIEKLESSDVFGSTAVSIISPPTQNDPAYHYRLSVNYAQKL